MERLLRASLGPVPLPYVFMVALAPVWLFYLGNDLPLLYSLLVVATILLKGALCCHWSSCRAGSWKCGLLSLVIVVVLEIRVIYQALHIFGISPVLLVLLSTLSAVLICRLHFGQAGVGSGTVIGIFSRSSPVEYSWLLEGLRNSGKVLPFCITNNNSREFESCVSRCSAAILYHSKTRGRVNITDVTDSLYDQEVRYMAQQLGRTKVQVVIDDLDDSSNENMRRILSSQATLQQLTSNLFLFTTREKSNREHMTERLRSITKAVSQGWASSSISDLIPGLVLAVPWLHFACNGFQGMILVLSNTSHSLLLCCLLPGTLRVPQAGLAVLLVVELFAVFWNYSGIIAGLLASQSLGTAVYALYWTLSSQSSSAAR